jgi:hypothetical protein
MKNPPRLTGRQERECAARFDGIELKLQVLLPQEFDRIYSNRFLGYQWEYELLEPHRFFLMKGFESRHPQTYRSLIFASNGVGDHLGFLLRKDSDVELEGVVYEFNHETGEVIPYFTR